MMFGTRSDKLLTDIGIQTRLARIKLASQRTYLFGNGR